MNKLNLDMQFRHEAFILFKESISMLVRACATNCKINVGLEKGLLLYTLRFNNEACEMQELNNLLQSRDLGERLNAIKATISISVHKRDFIGDFKVPVTEKAEIGCISSSISSIDSKAATTRET